MDLLTFVLFDKLFADFMRVLIVEDEWLIATDLTEALQAAGHHVVGPAVDSVHALALAANEQPQLALIDIDLEKRGVGIEVAERLHDELGIAVIFVTGQSALARSCDCSLGLITKPYDAAQAAAAVGFVETTLQTGSGGFFGKPDGLEIFEPTGSTDKPQIAAKRSSKRSTTF